MADYDFLKSKKLPVGVFAGITAAPQPATIYITITYTKDFSFLLGLQGFTTSPKGATSETCKTIRFNIPVTPPTVKIDFGNSKDTENVTRIGEVVLPKYQKATQFRWESFFPYDLNAKYLNSSVRNLSWGTLANYKKAVEGFAQNARDAYSGTVLGNVVKANALPQTYIKIFRTLARTEQPFTISMIFYDGGNIPATKVTLDTFNTEPENNGDYKYEISLIEWTDIQPKRVQKTGDLTKNDENFTIPDRQVQKQFNNLQQFWTWCKKVYPHVSKTLVWVFATYNGVRGLVFDGILKLWKIRGSFRDLGGRFGILSNMFGLSKITQSDVRPISESLKKLTFSKANGRLASFVTENKLYNNS